MFILRKKRRIELKQEEMFPWTWGAVCAEVKVTETPCSHCMWQNQMTWAPPGRLQPCFCSLTPICWDVFELLESVFWVKERYLFLFQVLPLSVTPGSCCQVSTAVFIQGIDPQSISFSVPPCLLHLIFHLLPFFQPCHIVCSCFVFYYCLWARSLGFWVQHLSGFDIFFWMSCIKFTTVGVLCRNI